LTSHLAPGPALILDMDGVAIDSHPAHRQAWAVFNRRFGVETTEAMQERNLGKRNDDIVRDFFGEGLSPQEVAARGAAKEALYRRMISGRIEQMLVPGLRAFLERHRGWPTALASNAEPENVALILDGAALRPYFQVVLDGHQVSHPKPHPEIFLRAAALLGVPPARSVVFEDSLAGVAAARAAGMPVIGVRTTHGDLLEADLTIDDFLSGDLDPWLERRSRAI
jgi:beta-phosphoglucomutase family hydrolase